MDEEDTLLEAISAGLRQNEINSGKQMIIKHILVKNL